MFRLVKVDANSLVFVYKYKKSGELVYFGATRTDKPKRVPVLLGYSYAVFDSTPLDAGTDTVAVFSDGEGVVDYAATVEVSEWAAENAIKNLIGKTRDELVKIAQEEIADAVKSVAARSTREAFTANRSENAFKIINAANARLGRSGMIILAFRLNATKSL